MNSDLIPGRRLYHFDGLALVHSSNMDVAYHTLSLTESVPVFKQRDKAGRMVVELQGYLSFPETATVNIIYLNGKFEKFSLPETFTDELSDVVITSVIDQSKFVDSWYLYPGDNTAIFFQEQGENVRLYRAYKFELSNGFTMAVSAFPVFPTQEQTFADYYQYASRHTPLPPQVGQTLEQVLANGWLVVYDTALADTDTVLTAWDGKPF